MNFIHILFFHLGPAAYLFGTPGTSNCGRHGYSLLTTNEQACRNAATSVGATFGSAGTWENIRFQGCVLNHSTNTMYWSTAQGVTNNKQHFPICVPGNKIDNAYQGSSI